MARETRVLILAIGLACAVGMTPAVTADQVPVNIVYPINGMTYPVTDPPPGALKSAQVPFSFGTTCRGGPQMVEWGVDGTTLGEARYYDEFSSQFVWKVPGGKHIFWVRTTCGENKVEFKVGA